MIGSNCSKFINVIHYLRLRHRHTEFFLSSRSVTNIDSLIVSSSFLQILRISSPELETKSVVKKCSTLKKLFDKMKAQLKSKTIVKIVLVCGRANSGRRFFKSGSSFYGSEKNVSYGQNQI